MTSNITDRSERIEAAMAAANMAWWELEFPSGALSFSKNKTDMLGYDQKDFIHFSHFTDLIHPDDYEATMKAMQDHYEGRANYYETKYRIKSKDGSYKTFYDKGSIVERGEGTFIIAGIVVDVSDLKQNLEKVISEKQ